MAGILIYCKACNESHEANGQIPPACPKCQKGAGWTTFAPQPPSPLKLTDADRRFLRAMRIAAPGEPTYRP